MQLSNAYPGLQLATVLDDPKLTPQDKADAVARRAGFVQKMGDQLGETLALRLDLSDGSPDIAKLGLAQLGATDEEQRMVLATFRAYQRAWALAGC